MKKILAFLFVLALAVCMLPGLALAEETAPTFDLTKDLDGITIPNNFVTCTCTKTNEIKQYGQLPNGFSNTILKKEGEVWTVIILVNSKVYKEQFDKDTGSTHVQDNNYPNEFLNQIQFKLKYEGNKWVLDGEMPKNKTLHFTCDGNHTVPQPDKPPAKPEPENTSKPVVGLTGEEAVKVHCTTNAKHAAMRCDLLENSFDIGVVTKDETSGEYFCNITVHADKYVKKYNEYFKGHTLETEGQTGTIKLKWKPDDTGDNTGLWEVVSGVPVVFNVKCEVQPPLDTITIEVSKTWHDDSNTVTKPNKITVLLLADGKEVDRATITYVNDAWSHSFGDKPANDNDKPINYTVKEEDVPDWTPYYYTAGPWKNLLAFQIHNVPTEKTREIKVTKKVSGDGADTAKYFDFKVTLLKYHNGDMETPNGWYKLGGICTVGGVTFTNGEAAFKLKDGESFTITGIPSDFKYEVEEIAPSGYAVKVNGSAGSSISNVFTDAKTVDITFENVKESGGGNGGGGHSHYYPTTTPVPVMVIPPKTGDMTLLQYIARLLGLVR